MNFTIAEEEVLVKEVLKLDSQGLLLIINFLKEITDLIYKVRRIPAIGAK